MNLINYNNKKNRNQEVFIYAEKNLSTGMKKRYNECGNWIEFLTDRREEKMKVTSANFCKNRFCPMCAWRQANKDALKISVIMRYLEQEYDKIFIQITFTAPNVKAENLKSEITRYNKAFSVLMRRELFTKVNKGYIRKLEVTYNKDRDDYHAHFHVVMAVNLSYFKHSYIKQEVWLNQWRDVMKDSSITQVHVKKFKSNTNEIAKYAAKDSDYSQSQDVFDVFYQALKGRQILTYNGLFAAANKMYQNHELDYLLGADNTEYYYKLMYTWGYGVYSETERRELTEEEKQKLNHQLEEEIETLSP